MDWLNLHTSILDSPECLRCDPVRRATWIWLLRHCIGQENGGVILGCRAWGDTTWQQMCRVRLKEVNLESPLWDWEGDHLRVAFYPLAKQEEVQAKRTGGRNGGSAINPRKTQAAIENGRLGGRPKTQAEPNGREGKGKEEEGKGTEGSPRVDEDDIGSPSSHTPGPVSDRDHFRMQVNHESWVRELKTALCKIGPENWRAWQALCEVHTVAAVVAAAKGLPASERWPDRVADALTASRGQANPGDRVKSIKVVL